MRSRLVLFARNLRWTFECLFMDISAERAQLTGSDMSSAASTTGRVLAEATRVFQVALEYHRHHQDEHTQAALAKARTHLAVVWLRHTTR